MSWQDTTVLSNHRNVDLIKITFAQTMCLSRFYCLFQALMAMLILALAMHSYTSMVKNSRQFSHNDNDNNLDRWWKIGSYQIVVSEYSYCILFSDYMYVDIFAHISQLQPLAIYYVLHFHCALKPAVAKTMSIIHEMVKYVCGSKSRWGQ